MSQKSSCSWRTCIPARLFTATLSLKTCCWTPWDTSRFFTLCPTCFASPKILNSSTLLLKYLLKITDFGFSKKLDKSKRTKTLCGTPEYISPEVLAQQEYGFSPDFWALGVLAYEMLTGVPPFFASNQQRLFKQILFFEPSYPPNLSPRARDFLQGV